MVLKARITTLLIAFFLAITSISVSADTLVIRYPTKKDAFHDVAAEIVKEAYQSIGVTIKYKVIPSARSLLLSNSGQIDGELVRIGSISNKFENLRKVPVSHVSAEQMAWAVDGATITIDGWKSLSPYRLVFHRGYRAAEQGTKGMNVETVASEKQAFQMVSLGRRDIAIANKYSGLEILNNWSMDTKIIMLQPAVQNDPLFHFLHKKHEALIPKISKAMEQMKTNGRYEAIYKKHGLELKGSQ